jgi:hypothetical protein
MGVPGVTFEVTELKLAGIDDQNINTVHEYEEYLKKNLPSSECIRDLFIDVDPEMLLSDLYFFTDIFMIEIPDFVTFYDGKYHPKKVDFTIHPLKNAVVSLTMKIAEAKGSEPRTVGIKFGLKNGNTFSFSEIKENSAKLEFISRTYLIPNLETG